MVVIQRCDGDSYDDYKQSIIPLDEVIVCECRIFRAYDSLANIGHSDHARNNQRLFFYDWPDTADID